jgi:hypothetical protein
MRGYSVGTAALALTLDPKWLDNLLSQNRVEGVTQTRQGIQRKIAPSALYLIATVRGLNRDLQIPVGTALRIAHELWRSPPSSDLGDAAILQVEGITVQVARADVRARVDAALAEAVEMAPRPRRGRPRR